MSLKLTLFSVDGTLCRDGHINNEIAQQVAQLISRLRAAGVKSALWSNRSWTVNKTVKLGDYFSAMCGFEVPVHGLGNDGTPNRTTKNSVHPILSKHNVSIYETVLVGSTVKDMRAGVNNGLLLVRTDWYGQQVGYGFPVASVAELARFLFVFALRQHPIFWQIRTDSGVDISAAGPFSTINQAYAVFGGDARAFAKAGSGHPEFWFQFTVSSLYFSGLVEGIDYIASYPSHDPATVYNKGMGDSLMRLGQCFNKGYYQDLIVRHKLAAKSQPVKSAQRRFVPQLSTIVLNARPKRNLGALPNKSDIKLKDKTVLLVDDFCTSGRSTESARAYIQAAGGRIRAYSWLKTISSAYEEMAVMPKLHPYKPNPDVEEPPSTSHSYHAAIIDTQAPTEIQAVFDRYLTWVWP